MLILRFVVATFSVGLMVLGAVAVSGQDYPSKPIRIVTSGAGGGADLDARMVAQGISGPLGQPVIVDNRANGLLAGEFVSKTPPDGYTLTVQGAAFWTFPLFGRAPYDVARDFAPISQIERTVLVLAVHPSLPAKSVKELIALAKARPGELNYAASAIGASAHLATELFKSMSGANIVRVTYKGSVAALTAAISGEVQVIINDVGFVMPHARIGKLRALAVTSAEPSAAAPELLTLAASGVPGFEAVTMTGMFAPARTPAAIINRLSQETVRALRTAAVKEKLLTQGAEVVGSTPEEFAATLKTEVAKMAKVTKDAGIKIE